MPSAENTTESEKVVELLENYAKKASKHVVKYLKNIKISKLRFVKRDN